MAEQQFNQPEPYAGTFTWPQNPPGIPIEQQLMDPPEIDLGKPQIKLNDDQAQRRAEQTSWALKDKTLSSTQDIKTAIQRGDEETIRTKTAAENDTLKISNVLQSPNITEAHVNYAIKPTDPEMYWQQEFGKRWVGELHTNKDFNPNWINNTLASPEEADKIKEVGVDLATWYATVDKFNEDVKAQQDNMGPLAKGWELLRDTIFPEVGEFKIRRDLGGSGFRLDVAQAYADQMNAIMAIPDLTTRYRVLRDKIKEWGPSASAVILPKLKGMSTSDHYMTNAFSALNIATGTLPGVGFAVGKSLLKAGGKELAMARATKSIVKGLDEGEVKKPVEQAVKSAAGDLGGAAVEAVTNREVKKLNPLSAGAAPTESNVLDEMFTAADMRANRLADGNPKTEREIIQRLQDRIDSGIVDVYERAKNRMKLNPMSPIMGMKDVVKSIFEDMVDKGEYRDTSSTVLDVPNPIYDMYSDTWRMRSIHGKRDGTLFQTEAEAQHMMEMDNLTKYGKVIEKGKGFAIEIEKPIRRDSDPVREAIASLPDNQLPQTWITRQLGIITKFISPEETMSLADRVQRKASVYSPNFLLKQFDQQAESVKKLSGNGFKSSKKFQETEQILEIFKNMTNPETGKPGRWPHTVAEIEEQYLRHLNRMPDEQELKAIFDLVEIWEHEHTLQNGMVYKNLLDWGAEQYQITTSLDGKEAKSHWFHARKIKTIPAGDDVSLAFIGEQTSGKPLAQAANKFIGNRKELQQYVDEGRITLLQVHSPGNFPLNGDFGFGPEDRIQYILATNADRKPIDFLQVPRQEGGHFITEAKTYIAQAKMRRDQLTGKMHYQGDNILSIGGMAVTKQVAETWDKARQHIKDGNMDAARDLLDNHSPVGFDEFISWTKPKRDQEGRLQHPRLDIDEPIATRPHHMQLIDTPHGAGIQARHGTRFVDATRSGDPSRQQVVAFTQERDMQELMEVNNKGTKSNPVWAYEPAKMLNILPAFERSINKIANDVYLNQYKLDSAYRWVEHIIQNNAFDANRVSPRELRESPFYFINHPDEVYGKGISPQLKGLLEGNRDKIRRFTKVLSRTDTEVHALMQRLANSLYDKEVGGKRFNKQLLNITEWAASIDPIRTFRSMAFHHSLGLFSIPIFFLHLSTIANGMAIAGAKASYHGFLGGWLHLLSTFNQKPEFLDYLDRMAVKAGSYRPGEWLEARESWYRSGFGDEQGAWQMHDDAWANRTFVGPLGKFLKVGLMPFNMGLKAMRGIAWHMASYEMRHGGGGKLGFKGNPGILSDLEHAQRVERADILGHNMTSASTSGLTSGRIASVITQFKAYEERLGTLVLGTRTTPQEKARLLLTNAALFGLFAPTSMITAGLAPDWRKSAVEAGYQPGKNTIEDFMMQGVPSVLAAYITGGDYIDFTSRLSPNGFFRDWADHDPTYIEMLTGAVGTLGSDALTAGYPFWRAFMSTLPGSKYDERWPITNSDKLASFRYIAPSSVNNVINFYDALATHTAVTRGGDVLERDMPAFNGTVAAITGAKGWEQTNLRFQRKIMDDQKKFQQKTIREMMHSFRRANEARVQGNSDEADRQMTQFRVGQEKLPITMRHEVMRIIHKSKPSQIEAGNDQYFNPRRVPPDQQQFLREQQQYLQRKQ